MRRETARTSFENKRIFIKPNENCQKTDEIKVKKKDGKQADFVL